MRTLIVIFFSLIPFSLCSQHLSVDSIRIQLFDYRLERARLPIQELEEGVARWDLEALAGFLDFMRKQGPVDYDSFMKATRSLSKKITRKSTEQSFQWALFEFRLHLYRAVAASQFEEYVQAARDLVLSHQAFLRMKSIHPAHPHVLMAEGLFRIIADQVPDHYEKLVRLAGIGTGTQDGYRLMERAYTQSQGRSLSSSMETGILWVIGLWEFAQEPDRAWDAWMRLNENSAISHFSLVRYIGTVAAFKSGNSAEAGRILDLVSEDRQMDLLPHFYYQRGKYRLYRKDPRCLEDLDTFIHKVGSANFVKSAWLRKGFYHSVMGDPAAATGCYAQVVQAGISQNWIDKQALREATENGKPDPFLLNLRLLFDGGYYLEVVQAIQSEPGKSQVPDPVYQTEVLYRLGRSLEGLQNDQEALEVYKKLLTEHGAVPSYRIPGSALAAAEISVQVKNIEQALRFLDLAEQTNQYGFQKTYERQIQSLRRKLMQ